MKEISLFEKYVQPGDARFRFRVQNIEFIIKDKLFQIIEERLKFKVRLLYGVLFGGMITVAIVGLFGFPELAFKMLIITIVVMLGILFSITRIMEK